jgi:outer membrane protein
MKRFSGIAAIVIVAMLMGQNAIAQNLKFAHINSDELINAMPEYDSARVKLEKQSKELTNQLDILTVELNNKADAYSKEMKNLSDLVKQTKEQELQDMQTRIQTFRTNAEKTLQDAQAALLQPIFNKADKAIKDIGREGGYIYVFDSKPGQLLYFDETKSTNILAQVKAKLGLK